MEEGGAERVGWADVGLVVASSYFEDATTSQIAP